MTAELVIMNKSAVALAADSAVTIQRGSDSKESKVFNTANKVFALSKYAPVGIMVSGGASIMDVPWETIIKIYRDRLKEQRFSTVEEYGKHFFEFLDYFPFGDAAEKKHISQIANDVFADLLKEQKTWLEEKQQQDTCVKEEEAIAHLKKLVFQKAVHHQFFHENKGSLSEEVINALYDKYKDDLDRCIAASFGKIKDLLSSEEIAGLRYAVIHAVSCSGPFSEIVFTGFGEDEYFPYCLSFHVFGVVAQTTIHKKSGSVGIKSDGHAAILPFAQSHEIQTFIYGISPYLEAKVHQNFQEVFGEDGRLPNTIVKDITAILSLDEEKVARIKEDIGRLCQGALEEAMSYVEQEKQHHHLLPIWETTGFLNKEELAQMAETLVNLESFRKQVGMVAETVGGPIDVAVITKGDGFIWIKKKHYFRPELNHHFFRNYFEHSCSQPLHGGDINVNNNEQ